MYVMTVEFEIKSGKIDEFHAQMIANAAASRATEPCCAQFDVCADPAAPNRFFLFEVYADRAAFDAHLASAHFKAFDQAVAPWIAAKDVRTYTRLSPA